MTIFLMYAVYGAVFILSKLVFVDKPLPDFLRRIVNPWTVGAMWIGAIASWWLLPYALDSDSADVGDLGLIACMAMPGFALMASWALRRKHIGRARCPAG